MDRFSIQRILKNASLQRIFADAAAKSITPLTRWKKWERRALKKREIDDVPINDDDDTDGAASRWGFLMPEPVDGEFLFQGRDEDYPTCGSKKGVRASFG